ncbi:hypothetical protein DSO57_1026706 [Entomophthora muscae]|uniref:Uncharacterized protein n=1 Tax=Entomophthora muscae TaxID=34485 RepID=A0ACC2U027_9FUNG|nr:hypothetical protein DSO57_1026706 [Entomophthora muscae]
MFNPSLGFTLFDTSPYYNDSEKVLGYCLDTLKKSFPRDTYWLSTKVGRYGVETFDFSRERVRKSVLDSLSLLKTSYIDIVYCHDIEFDKDSTALKEGLEELFCLKKEGLIKFVGISGYPIPVLESVSKLSFEKGLPLDAVLSYCHFTMQNTRLAEDSFLERLKGFGVKYIFNASPLCMGLLSDSDTPPWHPAAEELKLASQYCITECEKYGKTLSEVALSYSLDIPSPHITSTIIGCRTRDEVLQARLTSVSCKDKSDKDLRLKCLEHLSPFHNYTWPSPPPSYKAKSFSD